MTQKLIMSSYLSVLKKVANSTFLKIFLRPRPKSIYIKAGTNIFSDPSAIAHKVTHVVSHPDFVEDDSDSPDDIALIKLKSPITFSNLIRPICLPERVLDNRTLMSFRHCILSGYGFIDESL